MSGKLYTGEVLVTFQDQTTAKFQIYRDRNIDYFAVRAISDNSMQFIADEIGVQQKKKVLNWVWVEMVEPIPDWLVRNLVEV